MPGESETSLRLISATERQFRALELRKTGMTYDTIALQLGYQGPSSAYRAIKAALTKTIREPAEEVRQMEVGRLDAMLIALWSQVENGSYNAIDRALKIMERRAKLLGLDAPTRQTITDEDGKGLTIRVVYDDARSAPENGAPETA